MKKMQLPDVDDIEVITEVANNARLNGSSYPHLLYELNTILQQYRHYIEVSGNAWQVDSRQVTSALKVGLLKNYKKPPVLLNFISDIRNLSPDVCPMCGSLRTSTVDHLLPKEDYPQWAVFSRNLLPACNCNIARNTALKGDEDKLERVLHPYFDNCMLSRLISCRINPIDDFRIVDISLVFVDTNEPLLDSVKFHVEKVIKPSGIINWLEACWSKLRNRPISVIQTLPRNRAVRDSAELQIYLEDALERNDERYGTPNNWESIFIHGLINSPGVSIWLLSRINAIQDGSIDPLSE